MATGEAEIYVESAAGYEPAPLAAITGLLEPVAEPLPKGSTHVVTEYETGAVYGLFSDAQGVDLSQHEGQSISVHGIFQTAGAPMSDFVDPTDVLIYVTSVESLEPLPVKPTTEVPDEAEGGGTTGTSPITDEGVLPDTGGLSLVALGLISLLTGGGLPVYGFAQRS